jgi:hypothetical protein
LNNLKIIHDTNQKGDRSEGFRRLRLRLSRLSLVVSWQQGAFEPAFDKLRNDVIRYVRRIPFSL